jgi:alkylhydroperoxidase family enzyme
LIRRAGSQGKVDALEGWRESDLFDAKEAAALEYAEAMTDSTQRVTDAVFDRLRRVFDDDAIVELTGLIAFQNLSSKFNVALDVPAQGFCRLPAGGAARIPDPTGKA